MPGEWGLPTHRDVLVRDHGMPRDTNPTVTCACGRRVLADVCCDLTALPVPLRAALGLAAVDYICDGCRMVLHVHRYLSRETLCTLLGAPAAVVAEQASLDAEHVMGMRRRPRALRATHQVCSVAADGSVSGGARLPHLAASRTHADSARELVRAGVIAPVAVIAGSPMEERKQGSAVG